MNKIIFWRSNFTMKTSAWALSDCFSYRWAWGKTLIILFASATLYPLVVWAEDSDAWPEPVYFPQKAEQPTVSATTPAQKVGTPPNSAREAGSRAPLHISKLWPFKAKAAKPKEAFNVVSPKPSAQKADPPASPYPLLRLPMPIVTEQGVIYPGFYLIKPETIITPSGTTMPGMKNTQGEARAKIELNANAPLLLTRQNQIMARIPIHLTNGPDENIEKTGTPSPITTANPSLPITLKVEAQLAADQKTLRLSVTSGKQHYESDSYPVGTDTRRILTF